MLFAITKNPPTIHRYRYTLTSVKMAVARNTSCNEVDTSLITLMGFAGSVSAAATLLTIVLVFKRRLYTRLVYRLATYQVSAGLLISAAAVSQFVMLRGTNGALSTLCKAIGFFSIYTLWINLAFTACMTMHLFCYAVYFKNLRTLEMLYVGTSLVLPAAMAAVPLTTDSYGIEGICWIRFSTKLNSSGICMSHKPGIAEEFALWVGPGLLLLTLESAALVVMVTILARRVCGRKEAAMIRSQRTALVQLLPLAAYPITLCILTVLIMTFRINFAINVNSGPSRSLFTVAVLCYSSIGLVASVTLALHVCMFASRGPQPPPSSRKGAIYRAIADQRTNEPIKE